MPTPQDINEAFSAALNANFSQIVGVILLVGAMAFVLLVWAFNRVIRNSGTQAASDDKLMHTIISNFGTAINNSNTTIENNTRTIENNTRAMEALRETQATTLSTAKAIQVDTGALRHDNDQTQARLLEIKAQLDGMETELAAIRTGVDSMIKVDK